MLEIPALRKAFEQLCECFKQKVSPAAPEAPLPVDFLFLKAEKSFCQRDLLWVNGGADVVDGASEGVLEANEEVELEYCLDSRRGAATG